MPSLRIEREKTDIETMIGMYCLGNHRTRGELCDECRALLSYAHQRLDRCKFGEGKPVCAKCPVHCYQPEMRGKVIAVMRYSGPRMLRQHPMAALRHLLDKWRKPKR